MGVFNLEGLRIANGVGFNFDGNVVSLIELMMLHIVSALSLRLTHLTKNSICSYCISFFFFVNSIAFLAANSLRAQDQFPSCFVPLLMVLFVSNE